MPLGEEEILSAKGDLLQSEVAQTLRARPAGNDTSTALHHDLNTR